ncbi:MAG TPA: site-2 protease family protein [Nitrososphaera sp.]|nr:site-2 protease family protein [Nitrososphaera sp.]
MATSLNGDFSRVVPLISSFYTIKDFRRNVREDYVEFLIDDADIKGTFQTFLKELAKMDMIATAKRSSYASQLMPTLASTRFSVDDGIVLTIYKMDKQKPRSKFWRVVPLILFIVTVAFVFVDGYVRSGSDFATTYVQDPALVAAAYTMSLMGILGIHELGHMIANKHYGLRASWPYFLPGIPGFTPTFGALIALRGNMTNRNVMFDVGIAGPIAGLIIAVIVSIYGSTISVMIPIDEYQRMSGDNQLFTMDASVLMMATLYLTGSAVQGMVLIMSPVLFAAWLGFLITFLNLMPAWQLDGGHIARSALGPRWHKILTYVSIGILFALGFYPIALLVLFFSMRSPESMPLDDVTPLSSKRKALFFVALGLAMMTAPIPSHLFGFLSF